MEFRHLKAEEVEARIGQCTEKGVTLLLYKDSRSDMRLLDESVGAENWQCRYTDIKGKLFCEVGIKCENAWIWKQDVGTPSNMESDKGEASDAFKRACFKWGVGRELYTSPFIYIRADKCSIKPGKNGKPQCYDKFAVSKMNVENGKITALEIVNNSRKGEVVFTFGQAKQSEKPQETAQDELKKAYAAMSEAINGYCERHGITDPEAIERMKQGIKKRPGWEQCKNTVPYIMAIVNEFNEGVK